MQILLSEQEYKEIENKLKEAEHYKELFREVQDELRNAYLVTCHKEPLLKKIEVVNIKENYDALESIAINYAFNGAEKEAIKKYINGKGKWVF
ncbi:hypothetical protein CLPUN_08160 [Clostridium puniceum]|uniref:Uncharacterized protein n=1 Tax=Clostridium puniceum TaxID=29367 RepID=A0A1S8TVU8_9CLOT|nr:hypothetical protein [Clostridium puniceum]OOM81838.1 hypothetical protein CLPUN_08160 [Clostridium puniceum]